MTSIPTSALGLVGKIGPVRKRGRLTYTATCPACLTRGALRIVITPAGDRPSCRSCLIVDVVAALRRLEQP